MPGAAIAAPLTDSTGNEVAQVTTEDKTRNQAVNEQEMQDPATSAVRKDLPQKKDAPELGTTSPRIGPTPENVGKPPEFVVNVTGLQYAWLFTYPDTGVVSGELHVPIGRQVKLNISANDVLHAFGCQSFV